jgi:hypothetical protein
MFGLKGMGWMTHYDRNPCNLIMALIEHRLMRQQAFFVVFLSLWITPEEGCQPWQWEARKNGGVNGKITYKWVLFYCHI